VAIALNKRSTFCGARALAGFAVEAVTDARLRNDVLRALRVCLDLLADAGDVDVEIVVLRAVFGAPDLMQEHAVGEHLIGVLYEGEEKIEGHAYHLVDIGNPHAVRVVDDLAEIDIRTVGPVVAQQAGFDAGCNVEFMSVVGDVLTMRVWERGVGETMACGTGMAAAAAVALNGADGSMTVNVPGGTGSVEIRDGIAWLTGPAEYSFRGVWDQG